MDIDDMTNSSTEMTGLITESDCCGNGCANCILNTGLGKSKDPKRLGKQNIMYNYRSFQLLDRRAHNSKGDKNDNNSSESINQHLELHFRADVLPDNHSEYFLDIPVGYHIMMRTKLDTDEPCLRPYSPFWVDALAMEFKILVNLEPNGTMSRKISALNVGDFVEFRGPIGANESNISTNKERCIVIITQGVAIAPTIRIVQDILENEENMNRVFQLVCYKDFEHAFFRDKLREFNKYWNYKSRIYLAHQRCPSEMCKDSECTGKCAWFLHNLWYKELVVTQRLDEFELGNLCKNVKGFELDFVIAGGKSFQKAVSEMIKGMEINSIKNVILL